MEVGTRHHHPTSPGLPKVAHRTFLTSAHSSIYLPRVMFMSEQISRPNDFNLGIIAEFRRSSGRVESHRFASRVVLLHHIGARTGRMRVTPLGAMPYEDSRIVVGVPTPSGGPTWAMNLRLRAAD
ncbi:nitroreductase/quinone reductase family protein [Actinoplanes sp. NBRC 103695]|uniref:nitroreductase/quinone reductase family protein n=1 Tax=Actinoplanes sp. NBRC 103695 TaxID=3032202 RepID=UPI003321B3DC